MGKPVVLVVDDEPDLVELVSLTLNRMNLDTRAAGDVAGARALLAGERFDLCLTDMRLPDGNGLELVEWIQQNRSDIPVAVITAHGNVETAVRALKLGAFDFVSKPLDLGVLRKLVASAIRLSERGDGAFQARMRKRHDEVIGGRRVRLLVESHVDDRRIGRSPARFDVMSSCGSTARLCGRLGATITVWPVRFAASIAPLCRPRRRSSATVQHDVGDLGRTCRISARWGKPHSEDAGWPG